MTDAWLLSLQVRRLYDAKIDTATNYLYWYEGALSRLFKIVFFFDTKIVSEVYFCHEGASFNIRLKLLQRCARPGLQLLEEIGRHKHQPVLVNDS